MEEQVTKWVVFKTILLVGVIICTLGIGILYVYKCYKKYYGQVTLADGTTDTFRRVVA